MSEIKKSTLHPYNDKDIDIYPKTNEEQVEGLKKYIHNIVYINATYHATAQLELLSLDDTPITTLGELFNILENDIVLSGSGLYKSGNDYITITKIEFKKSTSSLVVAGTNLTTSASVSNGFPLVADYGIFDSIIEI